MIILTPPKKNVSSGTSEELGDFPSKESACSAGDCCWVEKISWRRSPLQCPCLENPMDRGALWATVQGVTKSQIGLSDQAQHWGITPVSPGVIWQVKRTFGCPKFINSPYSFGDCRCRREFAPRDWWKFIFHLHTINIYFVVWFEQVGFGEEGCL